MVQGSACQPAESRSPEPPPGQGHIDAENGALAGQPEPHAGSDVDVGARHLPFPVAQRDPDGIDEQRQRRATGPESSDWSLGFEPAREQSPTEGGALDDAVPEQRVPAEQ